MNTNDLADRLEEFYVGTHITKAAEVLRQQADLIELLRMGQPNINYDKELLKPTFVGRELTDEEIIEVHINTPFMDGYLNKNLIDFARAILRKAQEK
jgi:hypothetical protein